MSTTNYEPTTPVTTTYAPPSAIAVPIFDLESYRNVPGYAEQTTHRMGAWRAELFDCCKPSLMPNCYMVTFCPCISLAQVFVRIGCMESYCGALFVLIFPWFFTVGLVVLGILRLQSDDEPEPKQHLYLVPIAIANGDKIEMLF